MDILGWLWLGLTTIFGIVWTVLWFLLGGWVVTLVQLGVLAAIIFGYKYGWARAPLEIAHRSRAIGRYLWAWARARDLPPPAKPDRADATATRGRARPRHEPGDVNVSTLLSLLALGGLGLIAAL